MRQLLRAAALLLAILLLFPASIGAAAPTTMTLKEHWFTGDNTLFHHGLAEASMLLSAHSGERSESAVLTAAGFSVPTAYTKQTCGTMPLLDFTIASGTVGSRSVTAVIFRNPTDAAQLRAIADLDGRNHGFTAGINTEIPAILCSALAALEQLDPEAADCIWITGCGYGGSAAELLAGLLNGETFTQEDKAYTYTGPKTDVRAYTFGAPAASTAVPAADHGNIFTINNPEDLFVYLPGEPWGYRHLGRVIHTDTFFGPFRASDEMQTAVSQEYETLCGEHYHVFSQEDYTAESTPAHLAAYICGADLAPTVDAYYTTVHGAQILSGLDFMSILREDTSTVSYTAYGLISDALTVLSGSESDPFVRLAVGTYLYGTDSPFYPILDFVFDHALDLSFTATEIFIVLPEIVALKQTIDNGETPEMYELLCAPSPWSYLAWLTAAQSPASLSAGASAQVQWMDVTVTGSDVFHAVNLPGSKLLLLAVYSDSGQMLQCTALQPGLSEETAAVSGAASAKIFHLDDDQMPIFTAASQ